MISSKLIKTEPLNAKDIKTESANIGGHSMHPKDQLQQPQSLGSYSGMYQRHPLSVQPPQHISREEELRRYVNFYFLVEIIVIKISFHSFSDITYIQTIRDVQVRQVIPHRQI